MGVEESIGVSRLCYSEFMGNERFEVEFFQKVPGRVDASGVVPSSSQPWMEGADLAADNAEPFSVE